jgi:hypothetical protein
MDDAGERAGGGDGSDLRDRSRAAHTYYLATRLLLRKVPGACAMEGLPGAPASRRCAAAAKKPAAMMNVAPTSVLGPGSTEHDEMSRPSQAHIRRERRTARPAHRPA